MEKRRVTKVSFEGFLERLGFDDGSPFAETEHLSDEEFALFGAGLPVDRGEEIAAHLEACKICSDQLASLLEDADRLDTSKLDAWITALRDSFASKQSLGSAISRAASHASTAVASRLGNWLTWLDSATAESFAIRLWKPAAVGGFLAPDASAPGLDVLLTSPYEVYRIEITAESSINVMVKGEERASGPVILLQPETGEPITAVAVRNQKLPFYGAYFKSVLPGFYLIAMSPFLDEIAN